MAAFTYDDLFGGKFLKADDLPEEGTQVLTITEIAFEPLGQEKAMKAILTFKEAEKKLVLNKTNAGTIAELYGKDMDQWVGKRIGLYQTEVAFQGKTQMGVRVRARAPKPATQQRSEEIIAELGYDVPPPPEPPEEDY